MASDSSIAVLKAFQNELLGLLSKMSGEISQLEQIEEAKAHAERLGIVRSEMEMKIRTLGQIFVGDFQPPQSFQKISHGEIFGDEEIKNLLSKADAAGGFGKVLFREFHGQKVAVKIQEIERGSTFKDEIEHLRTISHDNIISFRGWGESGNLLYLVMEHLDKNLRQFVQEQGSDDGKGLSSRITWEIAKQISQALFYLHSLQIPMVHGDLKPDNILLDTKPIIPKPKLCDFGLACHSYGEEVDASEGGVKKPKGHIRIRPRQEEFERAENMEDLKKFDVFAFGIVVLYMRTGKLPYDEEKTYKLEDRGQSSPIRVHEGKYFIRKVKLPDLPETTLGDLILKCCGPADKRPQFSGIQETFFGKKKNPFNLAEKGEFFECGFLKDTYIFVADSIVEDSENEAYQPVDAPPGYKREDLICAVEVKDKPYHDKPKDYYLEQKYRTHYRDFRKKAEKKDIDDNPAIALSMLTTERSGEDEAQKLELRYKEKTYCHHRAMRELWRSFEPDEKVALVPCLSEVHPLYSTSFGLHIAILTNEGPGKMKKFVFTQRSMKPGMASPGSFTCGAVESCSVKDYLKKDQVKESVADPNDEEEYVSLVDTAARGIEEELGIPLRDSDKDAITLNTIYLKFDNHEWGMCGFVDLTSEKIREQNRFSFEQLKAAFTSGPKDKFEHWQIHGVDFDLETMVEWIRENHDKLASSAKIVVVKVLQAFFGIAQVAKAFQKKM